MEIDVKYIQEHDQLPNQFEPFRWNESYSGKHLFKWTEPLDGVGAWSYKAYYRIGAEWVDSERAIVVTTKDNLENIDFISMFLYCLDSGLSEAEFSHIYDIEMDKPTIQAKSLSNIINPIIVLHFLSVVDKIATRGLKKDYTSRTENIRKMKGRLMAVQNERRNILVKRLDRFYCHYDEYSLDNVENRLIKKALEFSNGLLFQMSQHRKYETINSLYIKCLSAFDGISNDIEFWEVSNIKSNKLFPEYNEAVRLAKLILKRCDFSINNSANDFDSTPPFWIDMSLLYEHYVHGLLNKAYGKSIVYQYSGFTGKPDFLFVSDNEKLILDTKYIPHIECVIDPYIVRQLSGYSRDSFILQRLGYDAQDAPVIPCVVIYPKESGKNDGAFSFDGRNSILSYCETVYGFMMFYRLCIPLPVVNVKCKGLDN